MMNDDDGVDPAGADEPADPNEPGPFDDESDAVKAAMARYSPELRQRIAEGKIRESDR